LEKEVVMGSAFQNIAIVGTGLVGSSWAAFMAYHGFVVNMFDSNSVSLRAGHQRAVEQLAFLNRQRASTDSQNETQLQVCNDLEAAVAEADLVIEAVRETYDAKISVFTDLERVAKPTCILASSTSGLSMTRIQRDLSHPERTLITHPFNPVHLVPLVELVGGEKTDPQIIERIKILLEQLGKTAIVVRREVPGFIGNRLQAAVWREAIQLVLDGVGTVEDVDRALAAGPGLRWALMGQHMIFHLGGGQGGIGNFVDHIGGKWQELWEDMANWTSLPTEARDVLVAGIEDEMHGRTVAELEAWRDEKLTKLGQVIESEVKRNET
jgi:3-hydroxyacyl-CoA dehydrogenase